VEYLKSDDAVSPMMVPVAARDALQRMHIVQGDIILKTSIMDYVLQTTCETQSVVDRNVDIQR